MANRDPKAEAAITRHLVEATQRATRAGYTATALELATASYNIANAFAEDTSPPTTCDEILKTIESKP